jgi:hypothetical protein
MGMPRYYRFLNESCKRWQRKDWKKFSDVTPYCNDHRDSKHKQHLTESSRDKWFKFYCGPWLKKPGRYDQPMWTHKIKKFYWNIHPNEWPIPEYPRKR